MKQLLYCCLISFYAVSASAQDTLLTNSKPFLSGSLSCGGSFGTPGMLNFLIGYYGNNFGVRLEAGACFQADPSGLGTVWDVAGAEIALSWRLWSSQSYRVSACLIGQHGGSDEAPIWGTANWLGPGVAIEADYLGLYAEIGYIPITFNFAEWQGPTGSTRSSMPIIQIGYFR